MLIYYETGRNLWAVRDASNRLLARFATKHEASQFATAHETWEPQHV